MANYISDRAFTDYVHNNIAMPKVYKPINWKKHKIAPDELKSLDINQGIDYVFKDSQGNIKTVQERFRESKYQRYTDFTIRYRRDNNTHTARVESEYYKMNAKFFTYGITNCLKSGNLRSCTDFLKFAIIDLEKVYAKIEEGSLLIRDNGRSFSRITKDNKIVCPVKYNRDGSSSFFPIDIAQLVQLWGNEMVVVQKGFLI